MIGRRGDKRVGFLAAMFLLCFGSVALAQTDQSLARKFDEFGDIQPSDLIARLDNLAIEVQNQPTARAFLIVYRTGRDLPGLSNRFAHRMKSYMVNARGVAPERIITVDGGEASCLSQELWIVLPGGAPKPRPDAAYQKSYEPSIYKFDEHHFSVNNENNSYWREYPWGALEAFGQHLQKHPRATGYLIGYQGTNDFGAGNPKAMLSKERKFLFQEFGIEPSRIRTILGGYREWATVELWIANGRGLPIITSYRYAGRKR